MSTLPHALTARELELLSFLPTRLTSPEIAARWFVSVNTIKTHLAHLYRKLGVADRNSAIARAHELGLLTEGKIPPTG
jgi:LuxR family maltose regulon positive regulatory protein